MKFSKQQGLFFSPRALRMFLEAQVKFWHLTQDKSWPENSFASGPPLTEGKSLQTKKEWTQCCSADSEMSFVRILTHDMIFQSSPSFWLNFHTPARQFSLVLTKCLCCQQFTSFGILIFTEWAEGRCSLDSKHTLIYLWKEKTCKLWNVPLKQVQSITPRWRHFNNMKCSSRWILHLKKEILHLFPCEPFYFPFFPRAFLSILSDGQRR